MSSANNNLRCCCPTLGLLLGVAIVRAVATYFYSYGQNLLGQHVMSDVRYALYRKLLALQFSFYDSNQTGRLMSRVSSDVESTRLFLSQVLVEAINQTTTIILATVILLGAGLAAGGAGDFAVDRRRAWACFSPIASCASRGASSTSGWLA